MTRASTMWGTSRAWPGRAHLVAGNQAALCGMRVDDLYAVRPLVPRVCPECALAFVDVFFAGGGR
jgi:hypothetical protein